MKTRIIGPGAWTLLPPPPDACQVCARKHAPTEPHDAHSIFWQTARRIEGLPAATWDDALAHVSDAMHRAWRAELLKRGIVVAPRDEGA